MENLENLSKLEMDGKKYFLIPEEDLLLIKRQLKNCIPSFISDENEDDDIDIDELNEIREDMIENRNYATDEDLEKLHQSASPLKDYRVFLGLSLKDLAEKTGYSVNYIQKIERGDRKGSLDFYKTAARAMEINIERIACL